MKPLLYGLLGGLMASCATQPTPGPPKVRRAVLVHGFAETGNTYNQLKKRLERRGIQCYVPKLKPSDGRGGLARLAAGLRDDINREFGPDAPIGIVSFSMGGIVSRYYLQELGGAPRCEALITVSSPHHGTHAAKLYPTQGAIDMRPGSDLLARLRASEHRLGNIPVVSYRTPLDLIILPPESSIWERAENLEFRVAMHPLMLSSNKVLDDIERRLAGDTESS